MALSDRILAGLHAFTAPANVNPDANTSTLANPSPDLVEAFGVRSLASGASVSEDSALAISAFHACVKVISEDIAGLPWFLYRERDDIRAKARDHRLYGILHDEANPEMSAFTFRETQCVNACTNGNCYAWMEWGRDGYPNAFWPLAPSRMEIWRGPDKKLYYVYRFLDGTVTSWPASDILHVHLMSKDGIVGLSPVQQAREDLGLSVVTRDFGSRYFGQGLHAGGWFMVKGTLTDEAYNRLKASINDASGNQQAHKWRIAEEGAEVKESELNAEDAQFIQTRVHQMREVARWFRMKAHKIGDLERSTNNNIEHQGIEHVTDVVQPWAIRFETEVNRKALTPAERKQGYFSEMLLDGHLRGDSKTRAEVQAKRIASALLKPNEGRRQENLPPDPDGDVLFIQSGFVPLAKAVSEGSGDPPPTTRVQDALALREPLAEAESDEDARAIVNRYYRRHPDPEHAAASRVALRAALDAEDWQQAASDLLDEWQGVTHA